MIAIDLHKQLNSPFGKMQLDIQLHIEEGQLVALYGKSGAGKTSTIRILAGLMKADRGHIQVHEKVWLDTQNQINLSPQKREVGFVFQDYALFPNMTIEENLTFALKKGQDKKIVTDLIEIIELGALQKKKPGKLSGGQQQRVALARALVQRPKLLLLDEPLSALDIEMRQKLQEHLLQVHKEFGLTTILISHDVSEVQKLSDVIIMLENGEIVQQGPPHQFFSNSESHNQNEINQLTAKVVGIDKLAEYHIVRIEIGSKKIDIKVSPSQTPSLQIGQSIELDFLITHLKTKTK